MQALSQQVLRLYGIGIAVILGEEHQCTWTWPKEPKDPLCLCCWRLSCNTNSPMNHIPHSHCLPVSMTTNMSQECCCISVCAELEWERFLVTFKMLDGLFGRGLLQAFEALLTLELTLRHGIREGTSDFHKSLQLYRGVAGVSLLVCSGFYILGGMLCFGRTRKGRHVLDSVPNAMSSNPGS